jgi:CHAT domain-containing protein
VAGRQLVFNHQNVKVQNYLFPFFVFIFLALFLIPLFSRETDLNSQTEDFSQKHPLIEQGEILLREGQYQQSIEQFTKYLKSSRLEDRNTLICYWNLGILFWNIDQLDESEKYFRHANRLTVALNIPIKSQECETALKIHNLFTQAIETRNKDNLSQSSQYFKEASELARSIKSDAHELKILRAWSVNYMEDISHKIFLDLNKQALQLASSLKNRTEILKALKNIGLFYSIENDYSHALSYFFQALDSAQRNQDDKEITFCLNNIASLYSTLGDNEKSIAYYSEILKLSKSSDHLGNSLTYLNNLGLSYQRLYQTTGIAEYYVRAIKLFLESLNSAQKIHDKFFEIISLMHIGNVHLDLKQYDEALMSLQPALEIAQKRKDPILVPSLLASIGMVHLNKEDCIKAETYFSRALGEARKAHSDPLMMRSFYGLGLCKERSGDYGQAISNYDECLRIVDKIGSRIVDDINRAGYAQDKAEIYQKLINLYYSLFQKTKSNIFEKEIFSVAEKGKARSFVEYLERLGVRRSAPAAGKSNPEEEKLKTSRLDILKKLAESGLDIEKKSRLEIQLRRIDDMASIMNTNEFLQTETAEIPIKPLALDAVQKKLLKSDTALIEYILGNERSFLIFISSASYKVIELPPQDKITNMLTGFLRYLEDSGMNPTTGTAAARRLYKELFSPVESLIPKSVTNLIIVPDGILFDLPFETLVCNQDEKSRVDYLINHYFLSYSPSVSAYFNLLKRPKPASYRKDLLAFGAPSYSTPVFPGNKNSRSPSQILLELYEKSGFSVSPIPYSEKEVTEISRYFKADKRDVFVKTRASEQTLKSINLNDYRIVHFACHAFSDESFPLRSALVFSLEDEGEEDGFFQVLEMYRFRLNAELTVLSACQTGKGKNIQNEGVLGLPRVFFYMGSRSVISTLWRIDDKATSQFMGYFYEYYARGKSKSQALQLAKKKMMKSRYSHPFYWGAFVLTGES